MPKNSAVAEIAKFNPSFLLTPWIKIHGYWKEAALRAWGSCSRNFTISSVMLFPIPYLAVESTNPDFLSPEGCLRQYPRVSTRGGN